ncbi:hypothetical protein [Nocardia gipuzkoensis]
MNAEPVMVWREGSWLCRTCFDRMTHLIEQTPRQVEWIRANVERGARLEREGSNPNGASSSAPCDVDAIDQADAELRMLARWCAYAGLRKLPGPVHRDSNGVARMIRGGDTGVVVFASRWLAAELPKIETRGWVLEMFADVEKVRRRSERRWPLAEKVRGSESDSSELQGLLFA